MAAPENYHAMRRKGRFEKPLAQLFRRLDEDASGFFATEVQS
jgi:hypothetical protein